MTPDGYGQDVRLSVVLRHGAVMLPGSLPLPSLQKKVDVPAFILRKRMSSEPPGTFGRDHRDGPPHPSEAKAGLLRFL